MAHTLTLEVPDEIYQALIDQAKEQGRSLEDLASAGLIRAVHSYRDPLLKWSGFIKSGPDNVGERHDHYLGQALLEELRGNQNGRCIRGCSSGALRKPCPPTI